MFKIFWFFLRYIGVNFEVENIYMVFIVVLLVFVLKKSVFILIFEIFLYF